MRNLLWLLFLGPLCLPAQETFHTQEAWLLDLITRYEDSIQTQPNVWDFRRFSDRKVKAVIKPTQKSKVFDKGTYQRRLSRHGSLREQYAFFFDSRQAFSMQDRRYPEPVMVTYLSLSLTQNRLEQAVLRMRVREAPDSPIIALEVQYLRDRSITFVQNFPSGAQQPLETYFVIP